jgi:hypothetical protein
MYCARKKLSLSLLRFDRKGEREQAGRLAGERYHDQAISITADR